MLLTSFHMEILRMTEENCKPNCPLPVQKKTLRAWTVVKAFWLADRAVMFGRWASEHVSEALDALANL